MRRPIESCVDVRLTAVVGLLALTASCGGHPGTIKTGKTFWASNQTHEETARLVFRSPIGWQVQPLGPQAGDVSPKVILDHKYHLHRVTPDGDLWVLGDSETNLYVWRGRPDQPPVEIHELRGRASAMVLTPDRKTLVVSRHADFARPQSQWKYTEDDRLYLVNLDTLAVNVIPRESKRWVMQMRWGDIDKETKKPTALFLRLQQTRERPEEIQRVDWATKARTVVNKGEKFHSASAFAMGRPRGLVAGCEAVGTLNADDTGVFLNRSVNDKVDSRHLVVLEGRKRGFHDYQPTFSELEFGPGCGVVYFVFGRTIYTVALNGPQKVAQLATGGDFMFLSPETAGPPAIP